MGNIKVKILVYSFFVVKQNHRYQYQEISKPDFSIFYLFIRKLIDINE